MQELLDEFDVIECFEVPGHQLQVGEITKHQMELYAKLGSLPTSGQVIEKGQKTWYTSTII